MEKKPTLSAPTAILIAGFMIAVGAFFGLQRRAPEGSSVPPASAPSPPQSPAGSLTPGSAPREAGGHGVAAPPQGDLAAPGGPVTSQDEASKQAIAAIEAHRAKLVERCWKPSVKKDPNPPESRFTFNLTFDAGGRQIIRGMTEKRGTAREDVTRCISEELPPLTIPAPGADTHLTVPFKLP